MDCIDQIDGEYTDKRRFLIFDYCGNFEFFRENIQGYESSETKSLTESIFCKMVDLIFDMQDSAYSEDKYQVFRKNLTDICHADIAALSYDIMSVRLKKEYVEKFNKADSFGKLTEKDRGELKNHIAPLIVSTEKDEYAKRFDNFMYGFNRIVLSGTVAHIYKSFAPIFMKT